MGVHCNVTNETARIVGLIADAHPERSIQIEWREGDPEWVWIITASDGVNDAVYIVNDETGGNAPATADELSRITNGAPLYDDA